MLDSNKGFVRLPGEQVVYQSPARTGLSITTPHAYPANNPVNIQSSTGVAYLTNQRVVYLPAAPTKDFQSFTTPLPNLRDTHVVMPWFGSNSWVADLKPQPGGNIPSGHARINFKFVFNEGGATDFHSSFERIKERLQQAVETSGTTAAGVGYLAGVNMGAVHLDQLPSYEASGQDAIAPASHEPVQQGPPVVVPSIRDSSHGVPGAVPLDERETNGEPLSDAPPGYEETQQQSIQQEFERRFSGQN